MLNNVDYCIKYLTEKYTPEELAKMVFESDVQIQNLERQLEADNTRFYYQDRENALLSRVLSDVIGRKENE